MGTIPAIFGQVMATYVATQLAELSVQTEPVVNLDLDHYRTLHQRLIEHEEILYGSADQVLVRCYPLWFSFCCLLKVSAGIKKFMLNFR